MPVEDARAGQSPMILVVGLGYVGLPLAVALAEHFRVTGIDIDTRRIEELKAGRDRNNEVSAERLGRGRLQLASRPEECPPADIYIVTVPTPVTDDTRPDLTPVLSASRMVAAMLDPARTPIVVYESTVYPGVTEDICGPLLEECSGLTRGRDFFLGYSPERINPGDREHSVERITKVVAGENPEVLARLERIYGTVTSGGVHAAPSIKVAEAAKVIENAQRDINIAFMNELAQIFAKLDISIWPVLEAAGTKWNFLPFRPGLVGGHCIGVDPYYLSHRAVEVGHRPQVILAGRSVNDSMAGWAAARIHQALGGEAGEILCLGFTFKENVPDLRNSKVADLVAALTALGHRVTVADPLADPKEAAHEYGLELHRTVPERRYAGVIGAVAHDSYRALTPDTLAAWAPQGLVADLGGMWRDRDFSGADCRYWTL